MSTHNKGFYEDLTKIIFELSSNTHLISSAGYTLCLMFVSKEVPTIYDLSEHKKDLTFFLSGINNFQR